MDIEQVIKKFKIDLLKKLPFYGDILTRLEFEPCHSIPTAQTNGRKVLYNPRFLNSLLNVGQVNYVLMHEVFHVLLLHTTRIGNRNHKVWNVACDLVVNSMLDHLMQNMRNVKIPFERPKEGLYSNLTGTETVEDIYEQQMAVNNAFKLKMSNTVTVILKKNYWGEPTTETIDAPSDLVIPKKKEKNKPDENDTSSDGPGIFGGLKKPEDAFGDEIDTEVYIQGIIKEAMQKSRGMGQSIYIPGEIYSLTKSKDLNWKKLLKEFLIEQISDDTSYATPERKYLHMDLILPGHCLGEAEVEEVWAFVDSSGSVGKEEMEQFLTQLYRIVKEFKCTLHLCYWDTSVTDVYKNIQKEKDVLKSVPNHSGGTDINCVYEWIRETKVKPDVMVILTDGYFGTVRAENRSPKLKRKTVLVLSTPSLADNDEMKQIGKVTWL